MEEYAEAFIESLRNKSSSPHTVLNYQIDLKHFSEFLTQKNATLESVDHVFIRDFLNHLYAERGLSKSSVSRKLACLRTFFRFMVREGRLKTNPAVLISSPRLPKKLPSYLAEGEAAAIMEMPQGNSLKVLRDRAILELLYATGIRVDHAASSPTSVDTSFEANRKTSPVPASDIREPSSPTVRIRDRSITRPSSTVQCPAGLWPAPRTATCSSCVRAKSNATATSPGLRQRAISAGRRSTRALKPLRAVS